MPINVPDYTVVETCRIKGRTFAAGTRIPRRDCERWWGYLARLAQRGLVRAEAHVPHGAARAPEPPADGKRELPSKMLARLMAEAKSRAADRAAVEAEAAESAAAATPDAAEDAREAADAPAPTPKATAKRPRGRKARSRSQATA